MMEQSEHDARAGPGTDPGRDGSHQGSEAAIDSRGRSFVFVTATVGKAGRRTAVPFGPFMACGAFLAIIAGRPLVDRMWPL